MSFKQWKYKNNKNGGFEMTKQEYIKNRIQYYKNEHRLSLKFAKECAEEDLKIYIEKYGEKSLTSR